MHACAHSNRCLLSSALLAAAPGTSNAQEMMAINSEVEEERLKLLKSINSEKIRLKAEQGQADQSLMNARLGLAKAKSDVKEAKAAVLKSATPLDAIRDDGACKPMPACLSGCSVDKYPIATCLKARKGEVKLCQTSELMQKNCCATCKLSYVELCKKVLANNPSSPHVSAAAVITKITWS